MKRNQETIILQDLKSKMVILTGPRQAGKTYLSREIGKHYSNPLYLNFDNLDHRKIIKSRSWLPNKDLLILDEIHKMAGWKNYLKGLYDTKPESMQLLVTGSARLEAFRGVGDSLAGRYFRHRLHPLSCAEVKDPNALQTFLSLGEFPEPFLSNDEQTSQRWRLQYIDGLIREDILDFEKIHDFKKIQLTLDILRRRVGSPISYSSIATDVQASPNTIKRYIEIFEALFIIFRVTPYSKNIARSLLKEPKIYFYDTGLVIGDEGIKLENHVAGSLLKDLHYLEDSQGIRASLHYLRTKEGKEIDFCRVVNEEIHDAIEVKRSDNQPAAGLNYFHNRYPFQCRQLVQFIVEEQLVNDIEILNAERFLQQSLQGLIKTE